MELTQNEMVQLLEKLDLSETVKAECGKLWNAGSYSELHGYLRTLRGDFLDELHKSQRRLEQLDYLIYSIKKKV